MLPFHLLMLSNDVSSTVTLPSIVIQSKKTLVCLGMTLKKTGK
jgi:hypothetical protein